MACYIHPPPPPPPPHTHTPNARLTFSCSVTDVANPVSQRWCPSARTVGDTARLSCIWWKTVSHTKHHVLCEPLTCNCSVQFRSVQFSSIQFRSVQFSLVRLGQFSSGQFSSGQRDMHALGKACVSSILSLISFLLSIMRTHFDRVLQ